MVRLEHIIQYDKSLPKDLLEDLRGIALKRLATNKDSGK